jgi:pilus assembly protein FimV
MTAPPPAMKLDDINLNLDEVMPAKSEGGSKEDQWSDVQTKFDLAKAYQEMGDNDGAREILQEVIKQGDTTQQEEAKKLLESLG